MTVGSIVGEPAEPGLPESDGVSPELLFPPELPLPLPLEPPPALPLELPLPLELSSPPPLDELRRSEPLLELPPLASVLLLALLDAPPSACGTSVPYSVAVVPAAHAAMNPIPTSPTDTDHFMGFSRETVAGYSDSQLTRGRDRVPSRWATRPSLRPKSGRAVGRGRLERPPHERRNLSRGAKNGICAHNSVLRAQPSQRTLHEWEARRYECRRSRGDDFDVVDPLDDPEPRRRPPCPLVRGTARTRNGRHRSSHPGRRRFPRMLAGSGLTAAATTAAHVSSVGCARAASASSR
jgi:hypothetical protein